MRHKRRRSASLLAALALGQVLGCTKEPRVETRTITMHAPAACAVGQNAYALFIASGDFEPVVQSGRRVRDVGAELSGLPSSMRSLLVDVADDALEWWGVGDIRAAGDIDVLLWPTNTPCALSGDLGKRDGAALGALAGNRVLVVGGLGDPVPATFVADLTTGAVTPVQNGLSAPRTRATVTAFGQGGLVAGGARADGSLPEAAEIFTSTDFDRSRIILGVPRADHGAVVLGTGETLLVGGVGANGAVLASMEIVDPVSRTARVERLASLAVARTKPAVLRLVSGEILVAGGIDAQGNPVTALEWFTPDARVPSRRGQTLVARKRQAFVALPGGGALAVIAPDTGETLHSVWVIRADGVPEAAADLLAPLTDVRLFAGAQGKPLLWTGERWLQWQPWSGSFAAFAAADGASGPSSAAVLSPDSGLAVWLSGAKLEGMRFDTRGEYSSVVHSLLVSDTTLTAPDRLVAPGVTAITFDAQRGLTLQQDATVFLTDATYASLSLELDAPSGAPPRIVLRDEVGVELEVGGPACPLASGAPIHLVRSGAEVTGGDHTCAVRADARLSVGFRGAVPESTLRNVRIHR